MVIMTKQAVLFLHPAGGKDFRAPNGYIGQCPEWVTKTRQFKEMVSDGMIVASATSKDKDLAAAEEKALRKNGKSGRGSKKQEDTPEEKPEESAGEPEGTAAPEEKPEE